MKEKIGIALAGFIGGIGPSVAEFVSLTKSDGIPGIPFFIGAIVMGIMGLSIALIARETVPWKAFTQGMGAPALLSSTATAVTSVAFFISPTPTLYADPHIDTPIHEKSIITDTIIESDSLNSKIISDSVLLIIDGIHQKAVPGSIIVIQKDEFEATYKVPDRDTINLEIKIHDPSFRRSLVQGLLPMQDALTKKFEKKLIIKEEKAK